MYEFDSVSVSSFEAASLAATLTEKSADGWDVVAVIPAGSDVVAYLRRSKGAADSAAAERETEEKPVDTIPASGESAAAEMLTPTAAAAPAASSSDTGGTGWGATSDTAASGTSWGGGSSSAGGWTGGTETSSWGGSAQQTQPAATSTPSVPAGWYADPAGRFELRYWDGNAWTEHVSRGGQQYTDPPVA